MNPIAKFFYQLTLALWVGGMTVLSLIVAPSLFRTFNRDIAGSAVGAILPSYYTFNLSLSVIALILLIFFFRNKSLKLVKISISMLVIAVFLNLFVQFRLFPQVLEIKKQIPSFEAVSKSHPLRQEFGRLHGFSSALNLIVLLEGLVLFGFASRLCKEEG